MGAYTRDDRDGVERDMAQVYQYFPILKERADQDAGLLSGGQQQRVAIARAVIAVKILKRFKFLPRIDKNFDYYFCCAVACLCLQWLLLLTLAAAAKATSIPANTRENSLCSYAFSIRCSDHATSATSKIKIGINIFLNISS
jgi:hypothetical protein